MAMNNGAERVGVTIQLCMPLSLHLLQSTEMSAVTQSRASNDYQPGNDQWRIGTTSILHWSIGIVPFKDNFFSNSDNQKGCNPHYLKGCIEPNAELEALVATLSAGPVGPSDSIGMINISRVMQTCRDDGMLLKPDRPAFTVELVFQNQFIRNTSWIDDLTHTFSYHETAGYSWHYILAANLSTDYTIFPHDIGFQSGEGLAYDYHQLLEQYNATGSIKQVRFSQFDADHPLSLASSISYLHNPPVHFQYQVIAPTFTNNWTLLGEVGKFVTASAQRFKEVSINNQNIELNLIGNPNEIVNIALVTNGMSPFVFTCQLGDALGQATIKCDSTGVCKCIGE